MMERKGLETSRYLGGDSMLSILICDDDTTVLTAIRAITESVLKEFDKKARIYTFTDATSISEQILSDCDIAFLDIDFDGAGYNGMDIARKIRSLRLIQLLSLLQTSLSMHRKGMRFKHFAIS